jgi:hypothetical protein
MTRRAPDWKFRLLCKRCNSYRHTGITIIRKEGYRLLLWCSRCKVEAHQLDETSEPNEWDVLLEDQRTKT